ncbi:MAG: SDR family oxidoreductase [Alphaproteobacteria bacterium]|nr:SDR family oxidoreductase [Alphaproteobacteria bacterium]
MPAPQQQRNEAMSHQTILITGASRGVGLALTQAFAAKGYAVIATCRNPDTATQLKKLAHENTAVSILPLDVADAASLQSLTASLGDQPIDILINNAGISSGANPHVTALDNDASQNIGTLDPAAWEKLFRVNTIAPLMVTQALLPNLKKAETRKIAMISSGWGSIANMDEGVFMAYGSSKAALNYATKSIALSLQTERFVVVTLNPGWVQTDMGSPKADLTPNESAARLLRVITMLTPEQTGLFIRHTGEILPW